MTARQREPARTPPAEASVAAFEVDRWTHWLGGLVERHRRACRRLGALEGRMLRDELAAVEVVAPIYVAGLARSGSTILLETLAAHPKAASHRYRDYPGVFFPIAWNRLLDRMPGGAGQPVERSHKDGILVTRESPEALEEMLWMAFFPALHDPRRNAVLDGGTDNAAFEAFYREHLRKLLYLRGATRYVAKGNYNVTRLEYLLKLFPDARFVLPVRAPVSHIASLMKQHRLFTAAETRFPRARDYLRRVGHFEFGLDRRPINTGEHDALDGVLDAWARGDEVLGWARYWRTLHAFVLRRMAANPELRRALLVVRFEDLCGEPRATLAAVHEHCGLEVSSAMLARAAAGLRYPEYYRPELDDGQLEIIEREAGSVAARFGYRRNGLTTERVTHGPGGDAPGARSSG